MSPISRLGTRQRVLSKDALLASSHPTPSSGHQSLPSKVSSVWEDRLPDILRTGHRRVPRVPKEVPGPKPAGSLVRSTSGSASIPTRPLDLHPALTAILMSEPFTMDL